MKNNLTLEEALQRIEELENKHTHKYVVNKKEIVGLYGITHAYIIYVYCETCGDIKHIEKVRV